LELLLAFLNESSSAQAISMLSRVYVVEHGYACCGLFMRMLRETDSDGQAYFNPLLPTRHYSGVCAFRQRSPMTQRISPCVAPI